MPGLRHAHTLQQLQHSCWILTPGRVFKQENQNDDNDHIKEHNEEN